MCHMDDKMLKPKSFQYRKHRVRTSINGFLYNETTYPYALTTHARTEVYFSCKEDAKSYIDDLVGGIIRIPLQGVRNDHN